MDEENKVKDSKTKRIDVRVDPRTKMVLRTLADMKDTTMSDFIVETIKLVYPDWF